MSSPPQPQNVQLRKVNEPALYLTTQTTIPLLTTVMLTFSAVLLAIAAVYQNASVFLPLIHVSTRDVALIALTIAALLFVFTTEACVKSQGWDYFALSKDRRDFEQLEDTPVYKTYCLRRSKLWHGLGARAYNFGSFFQLLGMAFLVLPFAYFVSIIIGVYLVMKVIMGVLVLIFPLHVSDVMDRIASKFESIMEMRQ